MRRISLLVAMAKNRVIGANGGIPWHLPSELKLFKSLTMGHHMVMGRKTYESINRLLPGRTTVIVTRRRDYTVPGAIVAHSVKQALDACKADDECFVIGGAELFRKTLPIADRIYLTVVDAEPGGDTFMPEFDTASWTKTLAETHATDERHQFSFKLFIYDRIR